MLRVFEAFAGYGSQSIALRNLGIEYEVVAISEIDKYAIKAYEAIHGPTNNLGDISKIDPKDIPNHDLFTYSFPCQDLSVAGKQAGLGKGTRSGLLYECEKVIEAKKPKYLLLENVKNLVGKKFKPQFDEWLSYLENLGYTNYWQVLNAKNYGVPQNRERVFVVSILGEHKPYEFSKPIPLDKCIKDILEDEVDEKYYINKPFNSLTTMQDELREPKILCEGNIYPSGGQNGNIYNTRGISPAINAGIGVKGNGIGSNNAPKILIPQATKKGYIEYKGEKIELPCIGASRGRNPEKPSSRIPGEPTEQRLEINTKGTSNTITTVQKDNYAIQTDFRIRKLTPRECFRLMGMREDDIDKIQAAGISNTQQYKMAGNSIVVNVLEAIFGELFGIKKKDK